MVPDLWSSRGESTTSKIGFNPGNVQERLTMYKFAFRSSGSATSALVSLFHHVANMLESNCAMFNYRF